MVVVMKISLGGDDSENIYGLVALYINTTRSSGCF